MRCISLSLVLAAGVALAGCTRVSSTPASSSSPVTPSSIVASGSAAGQVAASEVPDVSGAWVFQERIWVLQPSELNPIIGAPAVDTPMTQVVCDSEGTLSLEQDGATFWGEATQSVVCTVEGQQFTPPEFAFNPVFVVRDGQISGRSVQFETGHDPADCPNRGSVTVQGGVAVGIRAVGDCQTPFEPGEHHSSWDIRRP